MLSTSILSFIYYSFGFLLMIYVRLFSAFGRDNYRGIALTPPSFSFLCRFLSYHCGDVADIHSQFYASIPVRSYIIAFVNAHANRLLSSSYNVIWLAGNLQYYVLAVLWLHYYWPCGPLAVWH